MATLIILVFLVLQAQCITASGRRQTNNNIDDLEYSDDDYELPEFWEEKFSNLVPLNSILKPAERQQKTKAQPNKPTTKVKVPAPLKSFASTKPTPKTTSTATTKRPQVTSQKKYEFNVSKLFFPSLESYATRAEPVPESKYPWIARVVHSRSESYPYMCTAVCVEQRVFITAARCIATLKISITSVIYEKVQFLAKVFVIPDQPSKQLFDDVGIIVVYDNNIKYKGKWPAVKLFDGKRTSSNNFQWFDNLNYDEQTIQHKVIGYTIEKRVFKFKQPQTLFTLTELPVVVDINNCEEIFSRGNIESRFHVPCYHSCNRSLAFKCTSYHGTEGAAVYNFKTNKLLGLATWGVPSGTSYDLPVGFTVPNSDSFFKDLACARKIRSDRTGRPTKGFYETLCKS